MRGKRGPKDRPLWYDKEAYRAYYRERGLCPRCRAHRPLANGRLFCRECLEKAVQKSQKIYKRYEAVGKCVHCGKQLEDGNPWKSCLECRTKKRKSNEKSMAANRQRYYYRRLSNRCINCGDLLGDRDKRNDGTYMCMCYKCRMHAAELYYQRKAARQS